MNYKLKKVFTNVRVIILLICLVLAIIAIHPSPNVEGVAIRNVLQNSTSSNAGIISPKPTQSPTSREVITSINNNPIKDESDYFRIMDEIYSLPVGTNVRITTNKNSLGYSFETVGEYKTVVLPELVTRQVNETYETEETFQVNKTVIEDDGTENNVTEYVTELVNKTREKSIQVNKTELEFIGISDIGLKVYDAPKNNIRKGLELEGGTRVLLEPQEEISVEDFDFLISSMKERLNVYGLSDVVIRKASDLSGKQFIIVEIAGANEEEVKDLLAKQGKFEAKVLNTTVFIGGQDITYVSRSADQAGIDPSRGCQHNGEVWMCRFRFGISITPEAAKKQADATRNLDLVKVDETGQPVSPDNQYLSAKIDFYLDDQLTDSLNIGADLQGREITEIQISGTGIGQTQDEARFNTLDNMKRLQTILQTGSLPVKISIVKTDSISPLLGEEFVKNALYVALIAILAVAAIIFLVYRKILIVVPLVLTMLSEIVLILGFAALMHWNLDLAAIAGILIAVGTGVDHLVVITDGTLKEESQLLLNWKDRIKNAFVIVLIAFFTTAAAMIPLWWVGVGMLKGFAFTTVMGLAFGVFIARPAYAAVVEILLK